MEISKIKNSFSVQLSLFFYLQMFFLLAHIIITDKRVEFCLLDLQSEFKITPFRFDFLKFHMIVLSQKNQYLVAPALAVSHQI